VKWSNGKEKQFLEVQFGTVKRNYSVICLVFSDLET